MIGFFTQFRHRGAEVRRVKGILLLLFMVVFLSPIFAQTKKESIFVLGSARPEYSDIEDRIFREEIMRHLVLMGRTPVPVMEIESAIRDTSIDLRALPDKGKAELAKKLGASWIVYGVFNKKATPPSFSVFIVNPEKKQSLRREIPLDIKKPVVSQWQSIAEGAARAVASAMNETPAR